MGSPMLPSPMNPIFAMRLSSRGTRALCILELGARTGCERIRSGERCQSTSGRCSLLPCRPLCKRALHKFRVRRDHFEVGAVGLVGLGAALLPVPQRADRYAVGFGKLLLRHAQRAADYVGSRSALHATRIILGDGLVVRVRHGPRHDLRIGQGIETLANPCDRSRLRVRLAWLRARDEGRRALEVLAEVGRLAHAVSPSSAETMRMRSIALGVDHASVTEGGESRMPDARWCNRLFTLSMDTRAIGRAARPACAAAGGGAAWALVYR